MFSSLGLFKTLPCPDSDKCPRSPCLFSHNPHHSSSRPLVPPPIQAPAPHPPPTVPAKRPIITTPLCPATPATPEPPRKLQRVGPVKASSAVPSASNANNGPPVLKVNPATSKVALPVRQALLKTLYDHFVILYRAILPIAPSLAAEHALRQEEEVYNKSTKLTYRNAVIQCVAALKRRTPPDSLSHPAVGTEDDIVAREEAKKSLNAIHLTREVLQLHTHSLQELEKWGYFLTVPDGPGGEEPSLEGKIAKYVVAIDCEMICTTGGTRVARVSIVDGLSKRVFDELVRMDDGVEVVDYITRFSGITPEEHAKAVLPLASIRKSLDSLMDDNTIIIGHALENDLKTLRIIHDKCVDTAILFPHRRGSPYRRALKELVREHLERVIQTGDSTTGHSSLEDATATLDLVRRYVLNASKSKSKPGSQNSKSFASGLPSSVSPNVS
ncbi:hypothetical protein AX16_000997 [Volvariella volvacea WC 439]|nr:hypothetical protein AX16_000997 [Volvariella volvacea WC 439]